eukprot:12635-Heterococcus_DN1.PRE.2
MFQVTHVPDRVSFEHCSSLLAVARADAVPSLMLQLSLLFTGCVAMSAAPEGRRAFASKAAVALVVSLQYSSSKLRFNIAVLAESICATYAACITVFTFVKCVCRTAYDLTCFESSACTLDAILRLMYQHATFALCCGLTTFAQGASAAKYFGDKASASATALMFDRCATAAQRYNRKTQMDYPEVLKPENAVKDDETFGSSEQQQQQQQQCSWRLAV